MVEDKDIFELHADICKTLANPVRLRILSELQQGERTVNSLSNNLKVRQANISQHLSVLRNRGVVSIRKDGPNVYYKISNPKITKACNLMREVLIEYIQNNSKLIGNY